MTGQNFSLNVRMGNWNEELFLEEDTIKRFMLKRDRGELLVQKTRLLFKNLLKEVSLDLPDNSFIRFGYVIQITAPECCREGESSGIILSGLVTEKEVDKIQHFVEGCLISGSTFLEPCVRNSFKICSADNSFRDGQPLTYGQHFCISTIEPNECDPLYIESEVPHILSTLGKSKHPLLRLTNFKNIYCFWKILPLDHEYREELEGTPVPCNTRVVIRHVASNRNLAVEGHVWFTTFFGSECELSVYSYFNVYKRETPNNIWVINTKKVPNRLDLVKSCSK